MKIILLEDVPKLGAKNEVVNVSTGFANNFLIRDKKAIIADKNSLKKLKKIIEEDKKNRSDRLKELDKIKEKMENEKFIFELKVGGQGNVFGKVSTKEMVKEFKKKGYNIDRKQIISEGINHLGEENLEIKLDKEVVCKLKVEVVGV